jgi:uncharacterized protein (DUF1501 family)
MFHRREFLKRSSLLSLAPTVPAFLANTAHAVQTKQDDRILVVIQLDGGNDGINTVVPFKDEGYRKHRTRLQLPPSRLIKLDDDVALHPSLGDFGKLWESDRLAIVQGVGYPNPNRSHDVSMAIWQTCSFDQKEHNTHGWLGRALDQTKRPQDGSPAALLIGNEQPPIAIRGRRSVAAAINRIDEFTLPKTAVTAKPDPKTSSDDLTSFIQRSSLDALATAERLSELAAKPDSGTSYPNSELATRLRLVSRLIKVGFGTRVFYAVQSGYDTHAAQLPTHSILLRDFSRAIFAFLEDLRASQLDDRVAILCFSEFGRRVKENASLGTDHGTAGPVFLVGPNVKPGLHAKTPSLSDLSKGDLQMSVDFRRVYASVLQNWLGTPPTLEHEPLGLFDA